MERDYFSGKKRKTLFYDNKLEVIINFKDRNI